MAMRKLQALICVISFSAASAQSPADTQRYVALSRQIFCCLETNPATFSPPPADQTDRVVAQMHALVSQVVLQYLTSGQASSRSVAAAMAALQGDALNRYWEQPPFADLSNLDGTGVLVTAFAILSGGEGIPDVHPFIQFYSRATGAWQLQAEVGADFRGCMFSVAPITSPAASELWYVVWGKVIGDTGARLKLRLYGFDGFSVRTISRRDDLEGGSVTVSKDQVTLEYDEPVPYGQAARRRHVVERLRPTIRGLEN